MTCCGFFQKYIYTVIVVFPRCESAFTYCKNGLHAQYVDSRVPLQSSFIPSIKNIMRRLIMDRRVLILRESALDSGSVQGPVSRLVSPCDKDQTVLLSLMALAAEV